MKQGSFLTATLLVLIFTIVAQCETPVEQVVEVKTSVSNASQTRATIYAAGQIALVERSFPIRIPVSSDKSMYTITVDQVSHAIQSDSLLMKLEYDSSKATATILDYSIKGISSAQAPNGEAVSSKLQAIMDKKREAEVKKHTVSLKLDRLRKANELMQTSVSTFAANGKGEAIEDKVDNFLKRAELNDAKIVELEAEIKKLDSEINRLQREIVLEQQQKYTEISINVRIDSSTKQELEVLLTVSYQVSNVEWTPSYILKIDSSKLVGVLEFGTSIVQKSGEDWIKAKITLSTAKPSSGGSPPTVAPSFVSILTPHSTAPESGYLFGASKRQNAAAREFMAAPSVQQQYLNNDYDVGAAVMKEADSSTIQTVTKSDMTDIVTYEIAQEMNVYSRESGQRQQAKIATITLDAAEFEHIAVPAQTQQVFMKIKAKNTSKMPLMQGAMNILIDQQLVAKTQLSPSSNIESQLVLPGMSFETFVGADKSVTVTTEPVVKKIDVVGSLFTFNRRSSMKHTRKVVITNKKSIPINLTITDSIPSTTNQDKVQVYLHSPQLKVGSSLSSNVALHELMSQHNKMHQKEKEDKGEKETAPTSIVNCIKHIDGTDKSSNQEVVTCDETKHPEDSIRVSLSQQYILKQKTVLAPKVPKTFILQYSVEYELGQTVNIY